MPLFTFETARLSNLDIPKSSCSTKRDSTYLIVPNFFDGRASVTAGQTAVQSSLQQVLGFLKLPACLEIPCRVKAAIPRSYYASG